MEQIYQKKRWDRDDGWLIEPKDPVLALVPFVMRFRHDSQNQFEDKIPVEPLEKFVRAHSEEIPGLTIMYVIMAAMLRLLSQRPCLNRFVVYNKIYARSNIMFSLTIKRGVEDKGEDALIKPEFEPTDTLADVVRKVKFELDASKPTDAENSTDKVARTLAKIPTGIKRTAVRFLMSLDNNGHLPKAIQKASPWHTSAFFTNVGSLGIEAIYHHLYDFGTCSVFVALGKKIKVAAPDEEGNPVITRMLGLKFNVDERICDGHYYALSMRYLRKILTNPEQLLTPPKSVIYDDEVKSPKVGEKAKK